MVESDSLSGDVHSVDLEWRLTGESNMIVEERMEVMVKLNGVRSDVAVPYKKRDNITYTSQQKPVTPDQPNP